MRMDASADGPDGRALFAALASSRAIPQRSPHKVKIDKDSMIDPGEGWVDRAAAGTTTSSIHVRWLGDDGGAYTGAYMFLERTGVVGWNAPRETSPEEMIELAQQLPLEVMVLGRHRQWESPTSGFAYVHRSHGWGVIFKGAGHDRLVSRRWLDHGPWLVRHVTDDLTYVQFHDLDADEATAWAQAQHAHDRMGIDYDVGGYIHPEHSLTTRIKGLYKAADRSLTVARANGQPMSQREMLDLCAHRARMKADPSEPIERVRVVFMEERDARRHLHELWLRELECWYFDADGRETRADDTYQPERILPEWMERAEGRAPVSRPVTTVVSLGLANLLADPEGELPGGWRRDDLLSHLLDHHRSAPDYEIREILGAHVDRVSATAGEHGDLVVTAAPGTGGAMRAAEAAPLLAKVAAVSLRCELCVAAERVGLTLPAIIVPDPYPEQRPLKFKEDHPLRGVVVHAVGDVLARVRSLNREDLRPVEALLRLCAEDRFVLSAVPA